MMSGGRSWTPSPSGPGRDRRWEQPTEPPSMKVLVRLTGYAWRHKGLLAGAYVTMTGATLAAMVIPRLLGTAIDQTLASGLQRELLWVAGLILLVSVFRGLFAYGQNYLAESISQRAAYDLRNDFFQKLQSLSFGFHDKQQTGNLMSKATADVEAVRRFTSMGLIRGLSIIMMVAVVAALMLTTNWRLGLVSLAFVPPVVWRAMLMSRSLRRTWMKVQVETGNMTTVLQENLAGVRVVKAFGARQHEEAKFEEKAALVADHTYSASRLFASQGALMTFMFTVATGVILWFGGREVVAERLSPGDLAAFILYMGMLAMPVRMTGWLVSTLSRASSAGQRIFDVLDAESPVEEKPDARPLPRVRGHVRFDRVSLSYDSVAPAIRDVDLEAKPGQLVAILGAPGSGKSTIVQLLPRFYDASAGSVTIDGTDVRDVTLASLRNNVGIVLQDVFVFAASLRDNIAYGAENASMEKIVQAAEVAQLHEWITSLPKGYDTWVGERGITLSGGQRQRLAIARTLLLDPPILILDDSTSSVDMGTEYNIQQAMAEVVKGRTTFVIAHRLSTVRSADIILVLDEGAVVERGTHKELTARNGFYRRIHDLQLRPQEEEVSVDGAVAATGGGS